MTACRTRRARRAIADSRRRLTNIGDRELWNHQRVDEGRDQSLLGTASGACSGAALELLVRGNQDA